jgi:MoxR-like ATPase
MTENDDILKSRIDLSGLQESVQQMRQEMGKVIIGQQQMVDSLIAGLLANGHILLEGVPGIAKTLTAKLLARTVAIGFSRIQFTPDLMPSDVLGTSVFNLKESDFVFNKGPVFSNLVLIDEINRAPAKTQSALFEVMEERQVTVDGVTRQMDKPFFVVATQNPIELEGTYRLPEAQVDRFLFKLEIDYPAFDDETRFLTLHSKDEAPDDFSQVKSVMDAERILEYQKITRTVLISDNLIHYIVQIVSATRNNPVILLGASPRASLAMMSGAKAFAAMQGRDFVVPDDIQNVALPALRHRLILSPEKEMQGLQPDDVIKQIIEGIEVPR